MNKSLPAGIDTKLVIIVLPIKQARNIINDPPIAVGRSECILKLVMQGNFLNLIPITSNQILNSVSQLFSHDISATMPGRFKQEIPLSLRLGLYNKRLTPICPERRYVT